MLTGDFLIYGIYKNVRNAAWQCLIDNGIASFPVSLGQIATANGIKIIKNTEADLLVGNESGACFYDYEDNEWFIVYDNEATEGRQRIAIAHELGHIFLGHELTIGIHGRAFTSRKPESETQADAFALRLLAPACVLWGLDLRTPEDIATICKISIVDARRRAARMETLLERGKFLSSSIERKVYAQFKSYIDENM